MFFLQGGILMVLAVMVYQDFRFRGIYWWLFPLLLSFFLMDAFLRSTLMNTMSEALRCVLFLIAQIVLLSLYVSLRRGRLINIFKGYLGLGDLLFLLCIAFCFSFLTYIFFYLSSLMVVILLAMIFGRSGAEYEKIPLAGYQALFLIVLMGLTYILHGMSLRSDTLLLNLLSYGN